MLMYWCWHGLEVSMDRNCEFCGDEYKLIARAAGGKGRAPFIPIC
jgi:hypothetical protein